MLKEGWEVAGVAQRTYEPDFIVIDDEGTHWIVEGQADTEMTSAVVLARRDAAKAWVSAVNADPDVQDRWGYPLASESVIANSTTWNALRDGAQTYQWEESTALSARIDTVQIGDTSTARSSPMALPRGFVSFDFDHDSTHKILFAGQAKKDSPTPFAVEDWSSKSALPEREWEAAIKEKMAKCHMLVVLVGTHMATATGVRREIEFANDLSLPRFGVYVNGADASSTLPSGLPRNACVPWNWARIAAMVDKCESLGKNARVTGWA